MKKLLSLIAVLGMLAFAGSAIAGNPPKMQGWNYLGTPGDKEYHTYKKNQTENEFMLVWAADSSNDPTYFKMDSFGFFKMSERGKIWECEMGGRSDRQDSYYCHRIQNGVDKFQQCFDNSVANQDDNFLRKSYITMCRRNWGQTIGLREEKAIQFAYEARTYQAPNWGDVDSQAKVAEEKEVQKLNQENLQREEQKPAYGYGAQRPTDEVQSSNKMKILKHRSGGCTLTITNETVYEFQIKINGVDHGMIPTRKVAQIQDLNCDGFMVEAWPQGTVTGFVSRAFQHNQKRGKNFDWTLKYND